jgi:soluble lytic murein transglycosylase-like protein
VSSVKTNKALKLIPLVVEHSNQYKIDPLLTAVIIACESSWLPKSNGGVGEKGLMQVHGVAAKGFDLTKPSGQIEAGVKHFRRALDKCDQDLSKAFKAYATGKCNGNYDPKRRVRLYQEAVKRHRRVK